jgi:hypothetical protein
MAMGMIVAFNHIGDCRVYTYFISRKKYGGFLKERFHLACSEWMLSKPEKITSHGIEPSRKKPRT